MVKKKKELNGFVRRIITRDGSIFENAYYKIAGLRYSGGHGRPRRVTFCFDIWASQDTKKNSPLRGIPGKPTFEAKGKDYDKWFSPEALKASGNNPFAQAYLFAKTQLKDNTIVDIVE